MHGKLYLVSLLIIFSLLFFGCSENPLQMREVEISFLEKHPWEAANHESMWYTLVWIDAKGNLVQRHMIRGDRKVTLCVPRSQTTVFCAYPLGLFHPFGGACTPTGTNKVMLSQKQGVVSSMLLDAYRLGPEAVMRVNYAFLEQQVENLAGDVSCLDTASMSKDLLNGALCYDSFKIHAPLDLSVTDIPDGYWVAEREQDPSFWSYYDHEGVMLELGGGMHCFWNRESSLLLKIYVDLKERTSFTSLQNGPLF